MDHVAHHRPYPAESDVTVIVAVLSTAAVNVASSASAVSVNSGAVLVSTVARAVSV